MIAKFLWKASITPTITKNKWNYSVDWVKLLNGLSKIPNCLLSLYYGLQKTRFSRLDVIIKGDDGVEYYNEQLDIKSTECNQLELQ
jgi:hypothetical protein